MKIVSVNMEWGRYWERLVEMLKEESAVVVCVQEGLEEDMQRLAEALGMKYKFSRMWKWTGGRSYVQHILGKYWGVGILYRGEISGEGEFYYRGAYEKDENVLDDEWNRNGSRVIGWIELDGIRIGTTHFTWVADGLNGEVNDEQREDIVELMDYVERESIGVMVGDFNTPRGSEIYEAITMRFVDQIPEEVVSTIDGQLHRGGELPIVVDYIFATERLQVHDVRVVSGVSDHKAVVGEIVEKRLVSE